MAKAAGDATSSVVKIWHEHGLAPHRWRSFKLSNDKAFAEKLHDVVDLCPRYFDNRRQVASYAGLAPTPWQSGTIGREQGVSKAGNPRLRTTMVQLSWLWVRHQPKSALNLWFAARVQSSGGRVTKSAIVALARKLLAGLVEIRDCRGCVIEGAVMKTDKPNSVIFQERNPGGSR